jgi:hypothetical protein
MQRTIAGVLLAVAAAAACADTGWNPRADRGPEASPDLGPLPDGVTYAAQQMYAHSRDQLFAIDPADLTLTLVGTFGPNAPDINDLAVTPGGAVYALTVNELYRVDHKTAQLTRVTAVQGSDNVAMTFEPKGTLLASDKAGGLRRINPQTGAVEEIGSYGAGLGSSGDLVAIKDGTMFGVNDVNAASNNQLLTVSLATGKATVVGSIGFPQVWGLAYWRGTIYGLTKRGDLIAIDPKTGKGKLIRNYPYEFWGAAVTPLAPID